MIQLLTVLLNINEHLSVIIDDKITLHNLYAEVLNYKIDGHEIYRSVRLFVAITMLFMSYASVVFNINFSAIIDSIIQLIYYIDI